MKGADEIASRSASKSKRVSDELEARTTVTAPVIAMITPKRSSYMFIGRLCYEVERMSYLPKMFSNQ